MWLLKKFSGGEEKPKTEKMTMVEKDGKAVGKTEDSNVEIEAYDEKGIPLELDSNLEEKKSKFLNHFCGSFPRYLAVVTTDKQIYKPGNDVYVRIVVLDCMTYKPLTPEEEGRSQGMVKVLSPKGNPVHTQKFVCKSSCAACAFTIPEETDGGDFDVVVTFDHLPIVPTAKRQFNVRVHTPTALKLQMEFRRKGLGPGDTAEALLEVERSEGGFPEGAPVKAVARIGGEEIFRSENDGLVVDAKGECTIIFTLPSPLPIGEGTLTATVSDGSTLETVSRSLPVVLRKIDCKVFPEGGALTACVDNGLYIEAKLPTGEPADLLAHIVEMKEDEEDEIVGYVMTQHEGRGYCTFAPKGGDHSYELRVVEPSGIEVPIKLPEIREWGVAMRCPQPIVKPLDPLVVWLASPIQTNCTLTVSKREVELVSLSLSLIPETPLEIPLTLPSTRGTGVLTITVIDDESSLPIAERLVFKHPRAWLDVTATAASPDGIAPGSHTEMVVECKGRRGEEVEAAASITIVDDSLVQMTERRKQIPSLATSLLLESECGGDLRDAHVYLWESGLHTPLPSVSPPRVPSDTCLDLLLGTQGWRRFAYHYPPHFLEDVGEGEETEAVDDEEKAALKSKLRSMMVIGKPPTPLEAGIPLPVFLPSVDTDSDFDSDESESDDDDWDEEEEFEGIKFKEEAKIKIKKKKGRGPPPPAPAMAMNMMMAAKAGGAPPPPAPAGGRGAPPALAIGGVRGGRGGGPGRGRGRGALGAPPARAMKAAPAPAAPPARRRQAAAPAMKKEKQQKKEMFVEKKKKKAPKVLAKKAKRDQAEFEAELMMDMKMDRMMMKEEEGEICFDDDDEDIEEFDELIAGIAEEEPKPLIEASEEAFPLKGMSATRIFSHVRPSTAPRGERVDFAETIYFNACVPLMAGGKATIPFDVSDSITSFRAFVDVWALDGSGFLGHAQSLIVTKKAFHISPKLPHEITMSDMVSMPVGIVNDTSSPLNATLSGVNEWVGLQSLLPNDVEEISKTIEASTRCRVLWPLRTSPGPLIRKPILYVNAVGGGEKDRVVWDSLRCTPNGFPASAFFSSMSEPNAKEVVGTLDLPTTLASGSLECSVSIPISTTGSLSNALMGLIREPSGCFEQTSCTTYPLVLALQYFKLHMNDSGIKDAIKRSTEKLLKGYKRLVGFESKNGGYDWFGDPQGHGGLTAYGLMQFAEMREVIDCVDEQMLTRTRSWMLSRRDGKGCYKKDSRALDDFGRADPHTTNGYITWALNQALFRDAKTEKARHEALRNELSKEVTWMVSCDKQNKDAYFIALLSLTLYGEGKTGDSKKLGSILVERQQKDGSVTQCLCTITKSYGSARNIETTALSILAWLNHAPALFGPEIAKARKWLASQCSGGRFGSTQSTILALKALVMLDKKLPSSSLGGDGVVSVNGVEAIRFGIADVLGGKKCGEEGEIKFEDGMLLIHGLEKHLRVGERNIVSVGVEKGTITANFECRYYDTLPHSSDDCFLTLETRWGGEETIKEGEGTEINVKVVNTREEHTGMAMAIIGFPGGCEPRVEQLRELKKLGTIDQFETRAREVVIYWRCMEAKSTKEFKIDFIAKFPGVYVGPASCAYLYYGDEHKFWCPGLPLTIEAEE